MERNAGKHRKSFGVNFLLLEGNAVERARQHGRLLKAEIADGVPMVLEKKNEWIIRRGLNFLAPKSILMEVPLWIYRNILISLFDRGHEARYRRVMRAMAEETGIPIGVFRESIFHADALMLLARTSVMKHLVREWPSIGLPGCTSAVVLGGWTRSGRVMAARNMDYPLIGPWEKHSTVFFHEPTEPGEIPHVGVSSAGVHTAGLTGMNLEGITLATHAHFARRVVLGGSPVMEIGDEIVRSARSIGQAIDIARKSRRIGHWTFVVTSAKENAAVAIEMSPDQTFVREPDDGALVHTNIFHSKKLQDDEALISGGCCADLVGRLRRVRTLLEAKRGSIEAPDLGGILGDHVDPETGETRAFGNTVSVVTTVKSVVFDAGEQRIYVSSAKESPAPLADFIEVPWGRLRSSDAPFWRAENEGASGSDSPSIAFSGSPLAGDHREAVRAYREAYLAFHMDNKRDDYADRAFAAAVKAARIYPSDGHLWLAASMLAHFLGRFEESRAFASQALETKLSAHTRAVATLFRARALDVLGRRGEALSVYASLGLPPAIEEPRLRRAFERGLKRPYRASERRWVVLDLQFPDCHAY